MTELAYGKGEPNVWRPVGKLDGNQTLLIVPMLKDDEDRRFRHLSSGGSAFNDKQIALVTNSPPGRHRDREHAAAQRAAHARLPS